MFMTMHAITAVLVIAQADVEPAEEDFDTLVRRALAHHKSGEYVEAAAAFKTAFEMQPKPTLLYNMARSYERALMVDEAIAAFEKFLTLPGTTAQLRGRARKTLAALRAEKKAKNPPPPETVEPDPLVTPPPSAPPPPAVASVPTVVRTEPRSRALEWVLIGTGAAAIAAGVTFGILANGKRTDFKNAPTAAAQEDAEDSGRRFALIADVSLGVGIVTAAIGTILFLVLDDEVPITADAGGGATAFVF